MNTELIEEAATPASSISEAISALPTNDNQPSIGLKVHLEDLIDTRELESMRVLSKYKRGAWVYDGGAAIRSLPESQLGSLPTEIRTAIADYNLDKEAILLTTSPAEVWTGTKSDRRRVQAHAFRVSKPNMTVAFEPILEAK